MKAEAQKVVSIEYTLKDDDGQVLDTSEGRGPLAYLHGAKNIVAGLEKAIEGAEIGQSVTATVTPAEGYGDYDERAIQNVPVRKLSEKRPAVGAMLQVQTQAGPRIALVKAVRGDYATLDFNHPLAGKTLHFEVKVVAVREPTAEEAAHGHPHGDGGHQH
ncbi:MAG: peptidylprolyl isomerase [Polyangiales bacterium]